jgi:hypothetical protein
MRKIDILLSIALSVFIGCQTTPDQRTDEEEALFQAAVNSKVAFYTETLTLTADQQAKIRPIVEADFNRLQEIKEKIERARTFQRGMDIQGMRIRETNKRLKILQQEFRKILTPSQMLTYQDILKTRFDIEAK